MVIDSLTSGLVSIDANIPKTLSINFAHSLSIRQKFVPNKGHWDYNSINTILVLKLPLPVGMHQRPVLGVIDKELLFSPPTHDDGDLARIDVMRQKESKPLSDSIYTGVIQLNKTRFMWTILGSPLTSVAIPVWIGGQGNCPTILLPDASGNAPLCEWSLNLKKQLFPVEKGEGNDYLNLSALLNKENKGILQKNLVVEKEIIRRAETELNKWRSNGIDEKEMSDLYRWINKYVSEYFSQTPGYL